MSRKHFSSLTFCKTWGLVKNASKAIYDRKEGYVHALHPLPTLNSDRNNEYKGACCVVLLCMSGLQMRNTRDGSLG